MNNSLPSRSSDAPGGAAASRQLDIVRALLADGIHPDTITDETGRTALYWASFHGNLNAVQTLPDNGATPTSDALVAAAGNNRLNIVQTLLDRGAQPNIPNRAGRTALSHASVEGLPDVVQRLLDNGARPGQPDAQVLAATQNHLNIVQTLMANDAKPDTPDGLGRTAFFCASRMGHFDVVQTLLANGAQRDFSDALGQTADKGHPGILPHLRVKPRPIGRGYKRPVR